MGERASRAGAVMATVIAAVLGVVVLASLGAVLALTGPGPAAWGFLLALVPLAVVLAAIAWLDRWEPEPFSLLLLALLWGAGVSVIVALVLNSLFQVVAWEVTGSADDAVLATPIVSAPIVEEGIKGLGVLLLFLVRPRFFDGVVDGIVYAATIAAGFAFVENILYFGQAPEHLPTIFLMRGVLSPFAHVLFTICIGIAVGSAAGRHRAGLWWRYPLGLLGAILSHAAWNGSATLVSGDEFFLIYALVHVPVFLGAIVLVVWLRRKESGVIAARLQEYAAVGWFNQQEIAMLASLRQRTRARRWARATSPAARAGMRTFIRDSTSLAFLRQRAVLGRADLRHHHRSEAQLLDSIARSRSALVPAR
ncbi:PrsW family intramembrane metalloprotease [Serinibacter salmoneus]|uniref:RsiW-degrading membrane proteinase PrsW (M82 family) n=1 Tax=Serinibacter salmoneus TaxID=556530 RepID=A0A2A9CYU3_9MICO|nr:PrsW family intramembrane metalloprotease [Serinibacter salmoneus]PFG19604.1 RsiW-degrading membrane proteinase PrsW (M82 family) [Serinibacter salmoneus]